MARKRIRQLTSRERRSIRVRQVLFTLLALIVVASFIVSLVSR